MGTHRVYFTVTEVTERYVDIEATTPEEAERLVREYEFDNSDSVEFDSIRWEIDNVTTKGD